MASFYVENPTQPLLHSFSKVQLTRQYKAIVHITLLFSRSFSHYNFIITKWGFYYQDIEEWNIGALAQSLFLSGSLILSNKLGS